MKIKSKILSRLVLSGALVTGIWSSCSESFLEQPPLGSYSGPQVQTVKGIEGILINAYATLDGLNGVWASGASNWIWGSMRGGDAYKGTEVNDQPEMTLIEKHQALPGFTDVNNKWRGIWDGVGQANAVLLAIPTIQGLDDATATRIEAEARFIRAHHHFEGVKLYKQIPYLDETITDFKVTNVGVDVWSKIEEDFKFAYDNLNADGKMPNKGRANKWAAGAYLAKAYMFQGKWQAASDLLDEVIANGKTASGDPYGLNDNYGDNFDPKKENSKEAVFSIQFTVGVGSQGRNGNYDNVLNYPTGGPGGCCGFFQPSHNLVNSFKTDANGLPLVDTYNNVDFVDPSDNFDYVYAGNIDTRLDHTVGRKDVPYLDWGNHPGAAWIRDASFGGPYSPKKNVYKKADEGLSEGGVWGERPNANNYTIIRFSDVLLWKAEAAIELNDLEEGRTYINMVRARAALSASEIAGNTHAYEVGQYTVAFADKAAARKALQFERKLEFGMEGHRFFDLLRWDELGIMDMEAYLNTEYLTPEKTRRPHLAGATFTECDKYEPIPEQAISQSFKGGEATLKQITGCF
jgi:starch-binding outer membrane protein, SusD/RagB family